jgi:hypothetical protein
MTPLAVHAVGLVAPGLIGWQTSLPVLSGRTAYSGGELPALKPELLSAGERRRATAVVRLALVAAEEAQARADHDKRERGRPACVFASASGDIDVFDRICRALLEVERPVSPTHFHNSVHNAPAGYWAIATANPQPSVSISAFDGSFAAGLIEAATLAAVGTTPVLLIAYDAPAPGLMAAQRPIETAFAVALRLDAATGSGLAQLRLAIARDGVPDRLADPGLERLRAGNPAALSLPLLVRIASGGRGRVVLPYRDGWQLACEVVA